MHVLKTKTLQIFWSIRFLSEYFSHSYVEKKQEVGQKTRHSHCVHRYKTLYRLNQLYIDFRFKKNVYITLPKKITQYFWLQDDAGYYSEYNMKSRHVIFLNPVIHLIYQSIIISLLCSFTRNIYTKQFPFITVIKLLL